MAFQISIGDVLMLSKLAWDISQAFTSGRRSAPAEFQEVQNQLSSLTHALESLKSLSREAPGQDDGGSVSSITPILQNCRFTLEHLEALVNKYMIIENDGASNGLEKKRWREEIRKNWKKVRWTREGGDLTRLQHNLGVHINSLNLTIAVLNSDINQKMGQKVEDVHGMLGEIYAWFTSNLQGRTMSFYNPSSEQQQKPLELSFSLHLGDYELFDTAALCDNASFNAEWLRIPDQPVFKCNCQLRRTRYGDIHDEELMQYFRGSNRIPNELDCAFEWTIAVVENMAVLWQNIPAYLSYNPKHKPINYSTGPIESVQLVHYRNLTGDGAWVSNETADTILAARLDTRHVDSSEDEAFEYTITVNGQTHITHGETVSDVRISQADCLSRTKSGQENMVKGVDIDIELTDMNSASYLVQQLKHLQEGLLLFKVQNMLRSEKLVFELNLGTLMVYDYHITDALLKLVFDVQANHYRMVISNASRSICLSIELSSEALQQLSGLDQIYIPCNGPVWIAESNLDRTHVYQQRSRSALTCADGHAQQLLILMLQSVGRGDHGNTYPIIEGRGYNELEG
ncbi:hypothetical protein CFD26_107921 [Aspergillus turcosus]|uniref:Uncharacterized protein n=1 Tax=Aspergillus turcosus TaxID=1245748 RepID=A0A3R7J7N3_9EURO|nr:hypothetical protein CFD26_107921 [Aspergillus turcosus]